MACAEMLLLSSILAIAHCKPNVLMIIVDDLRPALGCYGDPNAYTPNIDKLAEKSFIFTNAFAQQALCAPSRNSFLTSRRPDSLHLYDFYSYWRSFVGDFTTIPQHFKENGYFTKSIGKVFHPGISSNFTDDYPYSWSVKPFHAPTEIYENSRVCLDKTTGNLAQNLICPVRVQDQPKGILPDQEILNEAKYFLKNVKKETDDPFFLAVGFHKPHIPFRYPQEYLKYHPRSNITIPKNIFRPSLLPTVAWNPWSDLRKRDDIKKLNLSFPYGPMPYKEIIDITQNYAASITYIDDLIGQLLALIDNETVILLFGDHGWSLGEHGEFAKYSNFDIATKVPLILKIPYLNQRKTFINQYVELVDLFPTLVDLTKVSKNLEICTRNNTKLCTEGQSFLCLLNSSCLRWKKSVFMQYPRPGLLPTLNPNSDKPKLHQIKIMGYSIRTNRYRYTEWVYFNKTSFLPNWNLVLSKELYDHVIDPQENLNLATNSILNDVMYQLHIQLILGWRYA